MFVDIGGRPVVFHQVADRWEVKAPIESLDDDGLPADRGWDGNAMPGSGFFYFARSKSTDWRISREEAAASMRKRPGVATQAARSGS